MNNTVYRFVLLYVYSSSFSHSGVTLLQDISCRFCRNYCSTYRKEPRSFDLISVKLYFYLKAVIDECAQDGFNFTCVSKSDLIMKIKLNYKRLLRWALFCESSQIKGKISFKYYGSRAFSFFVTKSDHSSYFGKFSSTKYCGRKSSVKNLTISLT